MWKLVVDIFEPEGRSRGQYPVVRHEFYGTTQTEARDYLRAHMKTDSFLNDCAETGVWNGVICDLRTKWVRFSGRP